MLKVECSNWKRLSGEGEKAAEVEKDIVKLRRPFST